MSGPAWTPGPWAISTSNRGRPCICSPDAWICGEIDNGQIDMSTSEASANARLIAAAPDLYEALVHLSRISDGIWIQGLSDSEAKTLRDGWAIADAALAKACIERAP